jgi:hypothetical protein
MIIAIPKIRTPIRPGFDVIFESSAVAPVAIVLLSLVQN